MTPIAQFRGLHDDLVNWHENADDLRVLMSRDDLPTDPESIARLHDLSIRTVTSLMALSTQLRLLVEQIIEAMDQKPPEKPAE